MAQPRNHKPEQLISGQNIEGRYYVQKEIGDGAFARVYSAFDAVLMEPVALKLLHNDRRRMAARERRILHQLGRADHPNIIRLLRYLTVDDPLREYRAGDPDGPAPRPVHILVYPLLAGTLLEEIQADRKARGGVGGLVLDKLEPAVRSMAKALAFLEGQRIVHLDLKPENILRAKGPPNRLVLADFGNASVDIANDMCYEAQTPWYRAPEVCLEAKYGAAVDLWSLGCIIYEMEVGKALFRGNTSEQLTFLHVRELGKPPVEFLDLEPASMEGEAALVEPRWLRKAFDGSVVCHARPWVKAPRSAKPNPRSPKLHTHRLLAALLQWLPEQRTLASELLRWDALVGDMLTA